MVRMGIGGILVASTAELRRMGETRHSIARRLHNGTLHKIMRGLYSEQRLTPRQLCEAYSLLKPHLAFTGITAVQLLLGQEVTLPLHAVVPPGQVGQGESLPYPDPPTPHPHHPRGWHLRHVRGGGGPRPLSALAARARLGAQARPTPPAR